jgi:hypothetical protein
MLMRFERSDVRMIGGSYKGLIGEAVFAATFTEYILTRFHPKNRYLTKLTITRDQASFLDKHWYSIDAVSTREPCIVEVKIWSQKSRKHRYKPRASLKTIEVMERSRDFGFRPLLAFITLRDDWVVDIILQDWCTDDVTPTDFRRYDARTIERRPVRIR